MSSEHFETFLQELAGAAASFLVTDVFAGVTPVRGGHPATVASSESDAERFDEIQYSYNDGPCLTAMRTRQNVLIADLVEECRFGEYRDHALSLGARSSLSLQLDGGERAVGALNLYSGRAHAFGRRELAEQRQDALARHRVIDQAAGVIMGQTRCSAEKAFSVLRSASLKRDVDLRTVADEIVTAVAA